MSGVPGPPSASTAGQKDLGNSADLVSSQSTVYCSQRVWIKVSKGGTSLVVQWSGIRLGMQGRQVGSLGTQDPT